MALDKYVYKVLDEQKALVLALDDPRITRLAKEIAFYDAMLNAAPDDPMDDPTDMNEMLTYLKKEHADALSSYMELTNEALD